MIDNKDSAQADVGKEFEKAVQVATDAFQNLADAIEFAEVMLKIESLTEREKAYVKKEFEKHLREREEEE